MDIRDPCPSKGWVLIRGQKAPILGRVCMDQMMVDVSAIPEVKEGDQVTLIGSDGGQEITMEDLARPVWKISL